MNSFPSSAMKKQKNNKPEQRVITVSSLRIYATAVVLLVVVFHPARRLRINNQQQYSSPHHLGSYVLAQTLYNNPKAYFGGNGRCIDGGGTGDHGFSKKKNNNNKKNNNSSTTTTSTTRPYLDWLNRTMMGTYESSLFLSSATDNQQGVAIHWSLNATHIHLALAVQGAMGWIGFGLSENGGMFGSDILLFQTSKPDIVLDAYIDAESSRQPKIDDQQDWNLLSSFIYYEDDDIDTADTDADTANEDISSNNSTINTTINNKRRRKCSWIMIEVTRLLNTHDTQDHPIFNDTNTLIPKSLIIAAWGDDENSIRYHGPRQRVRGGIRWYSKSGGVQEEETSIQTIQNTDSNDYFDFKAMNYSIQPMDTEYAYFCLPGWNDFLSLGVPNKTLTIVGIEVILDQPKFVHHFTLTASNMDQEGGICAPVDFDPTTAITENELLFVWAPGTSPLLLPDHVGAPIGPSITGYKSFRLQIHYNNPEHITGIIDSSGVRIYYSDKPRSMEYGILQLGDPIPALAGMKVGTGLAQHRFTCSEKCSSLFLKEPVTVMSVSLHMHRTGASMRNDLIRQGQIVNTEKVEYFDFHYQGAQMVQQEPYQILPGDSFHTICNYNTGDHEMNVTFGMSSQQEMCIVFIRYYPKKILKNGFPWICGYGIPQMCGAHWENDTNIKEIPRTFGKVNHPNSTNITHRMKNNSSKVPVPIAVPSSTSSAIPPTIYALLFIISTVIVMGLNCTRRLPLFQNLN